MEQDQDVQHPGLGDATATSSVTGASGLVVHWGWCGAVSTGLSFLQLNSARSAVPLVFALLVQRVR